MIREPAAFDVLLDRVRRFVHDIYQRWLGLSDDEVKALAGQKVI